MRLSWTALPLAALLALPASASATATPLTAADEATLLAADSLLDDLAIAGGKNGIPQELLARADCILIFPAPAGSGVASCRQPNGTMGSLAFYSGVGQAGDIVLLVMDWKGVDRLLGDKLTIGLDGSTTPGPVGRTARAATDAQMDAAILSWSRPKGRLPGAALVGSVLKANREANERLYGKATTGREILVGSKVPVPVAAQPLVDSIRQHMASMFAQEAYLVRN